MTRRVDAAARDVAAAYTNSRSSRDPLVAAADAQLATESDRRFRRLTSPDRPTGCTSRSPPVRRPMPTLMNS